jgi:Rrf2 family iron-sulfur cluster assembly transcriptional regulator
VKISTKGRYALRVLVDLAEHQTGTYVPLKDIAERQEISEKYLESIIATLVKGDILVGVRGKGGGYKFSRQPELITVGQVLKLTEGSLAPVACLDGASNPCTRAAECKTLPVWMELNRRIDEYLEGITVADLSGSSAGADHYVI